MLPRLPVDDQGWVRATDLLENLAASPPPPARPRGTTRPTGFSPLDDVLEGGIRAGELTVVAGRPGVGKTLMVLQWARHLALTGATVLLASYEHRPEDLLWRLLVNEAAGPCDSWDRATSVDDRRRQHLRDAITASALPPVLRIHPEIAAACERLTTYGDRLELLNGAAARTDLVSLERFLADRNRPERMVLIVDYLQKVPTAPEVPTAARTRVVAEGLKDVALRHDAAVIAVTAARLEQSSTARLRLSDLDGVDSLAYEADVVLVLEEKLRALSRVHLAYDGPQAHEARERVVLTVEKNRSGQSGITLEFVKDLANFRFDPRGCLVASRLVDGVEVLE